MKLITLILLTLFGLSTSYSQPEDNNCRVNFEKSVAKANLVLLAEVKKADTSLGYRIEDTFNEKVVEYKVVSIIKGSFTENSLFVLYNLKTNYKWMARNESRLSDIVFKPGNRHLLVLLQSQVPRKELGEQALANGGSWFFPINECFGITQIE